MRKFINSCGMYLFLFIACASNCGAKPIDTVGKMAFGGLALSSLFYAVAEAQLSRIRNPSVRVTAQDDAPADQRRRFWLQVQKVCQRCMLGSAGLCGAVLTKKWWDGSVASKKPALLQQTPLTMESWKKQFYYSCKEWPGMTSSEAESYGQMNYEERWQQVLTYAKDEASLGKIVDALTYDSYPSRRVIDTQRLSSSFPWLHPDKACSKYENQIGRELTGKERKIFNQEVASLSVTRAAVQAARNKASLTNPVLGVEEATLESMYHLMYGTKVLSEN